MFKGIKWNIRSTLGKCLKTLQMPEDVFFILRCAAGQMPNWY